MCKSDIFHQPTKLYILELRYFHLQCTFNASHPIINASEFVQWWGIFNNLLKYNFGLGQSEMPPTHTHMHMQTRTNSVIRSVLFPLVH